LRKQATHHPVTVETDETSGSFSSDRGRAAMCARIEKFVTASQEKTETVEAD